MSWRERLQRFWRSRELSPEIKRWRRRRRTWRAAILLVAHILGALSSVSALMSARSPQGATAWIVALNALPVVAVPTYWIFGRSRFTGYVDSRQAADIETSEELQELVRRYQPYVRDLSENGVGLAGEKLARLPLLIGNQVDLLIDGEEAFPSMLEGIDRAEDYILFQFYILRDDELGRQFQERLMAKAREGVRVYMLYDAVGSLDLGEEYLGPLREAGVRVEAFESSDELGYRLQMNFRNHRKILVVDGKEGWTGGLNVGDEYLEGHPEFGPWRDTHIHIAGPAAAGLQVAFFEDWHWVTGERPSLSWDPTAVTPLPVEGEEVEGAAVLIVPSGPADPLETASLLHQQAIHFAQERLWIASPYFVPDDAIMDALHLAALRGVDIRLLVPAETDSRLVQMTHDVYLQELLKLDVPVYQYTEGFLHQKVFLVDDLLSGIGTVNFDNRSFQLNFEVTAVVADETFARRVEAMLEDDFAHGRRVTREELEERPFWKKVASRAAYLTSPIQ